jgi:hypothetical protein
MQDLEELQALHNIEMDVSEDGPWERWCAKVEKLLGHSIDDTEWVDGYSLDYAYMQWRLGMAPSRYVEMVKSNSLYRGV